MDHPVVVNLTLCRPAIGIEGLYIRTKDVGIVCYHGRCDADHALAALVSTLFESTVTRQRGLACGGMT